MRKFLVFFLVFAVFVKVNHCALEELSSFFQKTSSCCNTEEDSHSSHSHNSPCAELSSLPHESSRIFAEITKYQLPVDIFLKFAFLSLNDRSIEFFQKRYIENYVILNGYQFLAKILLISPNAPPSI